MNREGKITVVVVTFNSAQHIFRLRRALLASSVVPERQIVIDNGSTDETVAVAEAAGFEVHRNDSNLGFGAGCNAGLGLVKTAFVLFCNPDAIPSRDALGLLRSAITSKNQVAIAGGSGGRKFSTLSREIAGFLPQPLARCKRRFGGKYLSDGTSGVSVVDYAVGAFLLCRTDAIRAVGGFDPAYFLYAEEEDLARRLLKRGWLSVTVPRATVAHAGSASSLAITRKDTSAFRFHSLYVYYRRYHGTLYAEVARFTLALCVLIDISYRRLAKRSQVYGVDSARAGFRGLATLRAAFDQRVEERLRTVEVL